MKAKPRATLILTILFGYVLLQFLWWEILLVRQTGQIINEQQKLTELATTDEKRLREEIGMLHEKKKMRTIMFASEGTVFLLILLFGVYKIKQAQDKEMELSAQQSNFFLSITHELKTPIAATKLQLQTLRRQKLDEVTRQDLIAHALLETERLNMLIDNILLASRLNTGEFILKKEKTELGALVLSVMNRYYKEEISKGLIQLNVSENIYSSVDVNAFPSIITNLVDNAIKYSAGNINIHLNLRRVGKDAILEVTDTGIGISLRDRKRVFDKFYRSGTEETRQARGTGLGLYIVDYLVKRHNGNVAVRDNIPKGSIFEIRLNAA
jgi:signal transduction histidine kinase